MKAIAVYSGGMDSFTMVHELFNAKFIDELACLSFDYGQRHGDKELAAATTVCEGLELEHKIVRMGNQGGVGSLLGGSALTSNVEVPEGHYAEENMKATVVPNRNMIMLSIATGWAVSKEFDAIYTAVHAGDHEIYPDCRGDFIMAMEKVTHIANYQPVNINAPFINDDKGTILIRGAKVGLAAADYADTWTCYNGRERACGKCGSCVERLEAFDAVGWDDPLVYEDRNFWQGAVSA